MESSPTDNRRIKVLNSNFVGKAMSDCDEGATCSVSFSSENISHADEQDEEEETQQEHQHIPKTSSAMANVERISNELEETRKSTEDIQDRIGKFRVQMEQLRELRNSVAHVRSRIVEEHYNDVIIDNSLPEYLQEDKPILKQTDWKTNVTRKSRYEARKSTLALLTEPAW